MGFPMGLPMGLQVLADESRSVSVSKGNIVPSLERAIYLDPDPRGRRAGQAKPAEPKRFLGGGVCLDDHAAMMNRLQEIHYNIQKLFYLS